MIRTSRFYRFLSLVLVLVTLLQMCPVAARAEGSAPVSAGAEDALGFQELSASEETDYSSLAVTGEAAELREESVKHFRLENGMQLAVTYPEAVHYRDNAGNWQEIDNSLRAATVSYELPTSPGAVVAESRAAEGKLSLASTETEPAALSTGSAELTPIISARQLNRPAYVNRASDFVVSLPQSMDADSRVTVSNEGYSLFFGLEGLGAAPVTADEMELSGGYQVHELETAAENDSGLRYENVFPGVDLEYRLDSRSLKENIIIENAASAPESIAYIISAPGLEAELKADGGKQQQQ